MLDDDDDEDDEKGDAADDGKEEKAIRKKVKAKKSGTRDAVEQGWHASFSRAPRRTSS